MIACGSIDHYDLERGLLSSPGVEDVVACLYAVGPCPYSLGHYLFAIRRNCGDELQILAELTTLAVLEFPIDKMLSTQFPSGI